MHSPTKLKPFYAVTIITLNLVQVTVLRILKLSCIWRKNFATLSSKFVFVSPFKAEYEIHVREIH